MMRVVRFNVDKHFAQLVQCLSARNVCHPTPKCTPKIGYVSYIGERPVAFAFLRRVEGSFGYLDGLTSNPECSSEERNAGIDLVVQAILSKAKKLNLINIMATSVDHGTIMRSEKHGFKKQYLVVIVADLTTGREKS